MRFQSETSILKLLRRGMDGALNNNSADVSRYKAGMSGESWESSLRMTVGKLVDLTC